MDHEFQHICMLCGTITDNPILTDIGTFCCHDCEISYDVAYMNWLEAKGLL